MLKADLSNYQGREQAYVKHYLLEKYLPEWAYKVGSKWESLVYIDGFAGPWETTDPNHSDSSFAIAVETLRSCKLGLQDRGKNLSTHALLIENKKEAFRKLNSYATSANSDEVAVRAIQGKFVDRISEIDRYVSLLGPNTFKFVLLDPMGWADIPMAKLKPFLNTRSCEVLINLMTKFIIRFLNEEDRATSYHNFFGREGVLEILQSAAPEEKPELAVKEYCRSLQTLCGFPFVSSAVILEPEGSQIRYFLVYATHHPRGVEVFKAAENKAANVQEIVRQEKSVQKTRQVGFDFADPPLSNYTYRLYQRYSNRARAKVIAALKNASRSVTPFDDLFCEAMAFPLVRPADLLGWLDDLDPYIELHPAPGHIKLSPGRGDYIKVIDRHNLQ
jgi:three-Cys-motif partner protein